MLLAVVSVCVAVGAVYWLQVLVSEFIFAQTLEIYDFLDSNTPTTIFPQDPATASVSFLTSLYLHPWFSLSALAMLLLFLAGVHRRVIGTSILVSRTREVLFDFSMDCDDNGKLILKPRQAAESVVESKWRNSRLKFTKAAASNQNNKV